MVEFATGRDRDPVFQRYLFFALWAVAAWAQTSGAVCDFDTALRHHQAGELAAADAGYRACIAAQPGRVEARSNLGAVLVKLGHYQDAIDQYQAALKIASADVAPHLRFNLALAYYKSFQIPTRPPNSKPYTRAQPADLNLALLLADCRLRTGEFQEAIDLAAPLEASHSDQPALDYVLGMALIRSGRVTEGQIRVDRILRRGDSAEGHFLLGTALFTAGNYPGAVTELAKAAAMNPDRALAPVLLGQALLFTGDADGAAEAFRKELAANPNDFDANFQLASILAHRGKSAEESRALLERAVQVRPGSIEARAALANGFHFDQAPSGDPGIPVARRPRRSARSIFTGWPAHRAGVRQLHLPQAAEFGRRPETHRRAIPSDRWTFVWSTSAKPMRREAPKSQWQSTIKSKGGHRSGAGSHSCPRSRITPPSACAGWTCRSPSSWTAWMAPPRAPTRPGPAASTWSAATARSPSTPASANSISTRRTSRVQFVRSWPKETPMSSALAGRFPRSLPNGRGSDQSQRVSECDFAASPGSRRCSCGWPRSLEPQTPATDDLLRHAVDLHQAGDITGAIPEYRAYLKQVPDKRHGPFQPGSRPLQGRAI